jgi:glutamate--cysteine ligase
LIRNFRRLSWLIPYLYGASPALCQSFLAGKEQKFPFEKLGVGTLYLPYATSLRMSDLGYTNSEQSSLNICYNDLGSYVKSVRAAINTSSEQYRAFPSGENGQWEQLNDNVLQIENELYSPIRPKQVAKSLEKPSDALEDRGVSYIEVRALDVNPFSPLGIEENQFYFLDVFLLYCLLDESPKFEQKAYEESEANLNKVVLEGRKPGLNLLRDKQEVSLADWAEDLFGDLKQVAFTLDSANGNEKYSASVEKEFLKVKDPSQTPSARWLNTLIENNIDNSRIGLELALEYKKYASGLDYLHISEEDFKQQARESIANREQIEKSDTLDFADFIERYFAK